MNQFPTRKEVEQLRERYPKGTRIHLHSMQDPYAKVPSGTKGTVIGVDDAGHILGLVGAVRMSDRIVKELLGM